MDNANEESIMDIIGKLKKIDYINRKTSLILIYTWIRLRHLWTNILLRVSVWMTIKYLQKHD